MKLIGTPFQIKVWEEIIKIPKGKTKPIKRLLSILDIQIAQGQSQMLVEKILTL